GYARPAQIYDELGQACMPVFFLWSCSDKDYQVVSTVRMTGPDFGARNEPAAISFNCSGFYCSQIRPGIRLAHPDSEVALTGRYTWKNLVLGGLTAVLENLVSALAISYPVCPHRSRGRKQLLNDNVALQLGTLVPTILLRPRHTDITTLGAVPGECRVCDRP